MYIRGKECLIDCKRLEIQPSENNKFVISEIFKIENECGQIGTYDFRRLGEYDTKERCIEILDEITLFIHGFNNKGEPIPGAKVYQMPER